MSWLNVGMSWNSPLIVFTAATFHVLMSPYSVRPAAASRKYLGASAGGGILCVYAGWWGGGGAQASAKVVAALHALPYEGASI